jgi:uncharacterized protein YpuA (DUF1002 family)
MAFTGYGNSIEEVPSRVYHFVLNCYKRLVVPHIDQIIEMVQDQYNYTITEEQINEIAAGARQLGWIQ